MFPMPLRLTVLFAAGAVLGTFVNWAIFALAWNPRPISPWSATPAGAMPRRWPDCVPILGWFRLSRETTLHGRLFWVRPLLLEACTGVVIAALYWWEIGRLGLVEGQVAGVIAPPMLPLYYQFGSHVLLFCLMLSASFIDIDEKIIPDEITVPGTILGLLLAAFVPMSLLPHVADRAVPPVVGEPIMNPGGGAAMGQGGPLWLEPTTAVAPLAWPPAWAELNLWNWAPLAVAIACYLLWCFALAPRYWRGRRGPGFAIMLIAARIWREYRRPPMSRIVNIGIVAICVLWPLIGKAGRTGLLTALVGLVGSGLIVWAVRLVGSSSLKREAMGFGDVTLMMMIGTFLGWQACLITFFLAPLPALVTGLMQFVLRRDDVIPFGPYLCIGAAVVVVAWAPIWVWAQPLFAQGWLVPAALVVCLAMLGLILTIWQFIKGLLFGRAA